MKTRRINRSRLFESLLMQLRAELAVARARRSQGGTINPEIEDRNEYSATDVYRAEAEMIDQLQERELKIRIATYHDMLSNILTRDSYVRLSGQLSHLPSTKDELSEVAHGLASRLHQRYVLVPAVEGMKAMIASRMYGWLIFITVLGILILARAPCNGVNATYTLTAIAGAFGATVSTHVRLYSVNPRREPLLTWLSLESGKISLLIAPAIGAVLAVAIVLLASAGIPDTHLLLSSNDVRQAGECAKDGFVFNGFLAKCMAFGFLAGWAERWVPDVLNKVYPQQALRSSDHSDDSLIDSIKNSMTPSPPPASKKKSETKQRIDGKNAKGPTGGDASFDRNKR